MSGDLTSIRVVAPGAPGEPARVELAARAGLAREVLVDRALPLLARARRLAETYSVHDHVDHLLQTSAAKLADDIADLIGHSTTDAPPCDELEAVMRDGEPARLTLEQLRNMPGRIVAELPVSALPLLVEPTERDLPGRTLDEVRGWDDLTGEEYAHIRYGRPMSGDPLTRTEAEALAADPPGVGIEVIPPCPMAPYAEQVEPATPAQEPELPPHDYLMPHRIGALPAFASREETAEWEAGVDSCPPNCPRRLAAESREPAAPVNTPMRTGVAALDARDEQLCRDLDATQAARRWLLGPGDEAWRIGARR